MFCQSCGKEINNSMMFCPYCGAKAGAGVTPQAVAPQPVTPQAAVSQPLWPQPVEHIKMVFAVIITIIAPIALLLMYRQFPLTSPIYTRLGTKYGVFFELIISILLILISFLSTKNIKRAKVPFIILAVVQFIEMIRNYFVFGRFFNVTKIERIADRYRMWLQQYGNNFLLTYGCGMILTILLLIAIGQTPSNRRALAWIVSVSHFLFIGYYLIKMVEVFIRLTSGMGKAISNFHFMPYWYHVKMYGYPHLILSELAFALLALAIAVIPTRNRV